MIKWVVSVIEKYKKSLLLIYFYIFIMYSYINQFLISLLSIPVGVDMFTRMSDVIKRLKTPI